MSIPLRASWEPPDDPVVRGERHLRSGIPNLRGLRRWLLHAATADTSVGCTSSAVVVVIDRIGPDPGLIDTVSRALQEFMVADEFVAQVSGHEYVVVLPRADRTAAVLRCRELLATALGAPVVAQLTACAGVADIDLADPAPGLVAADAAAYIARYLGAPQPIVHATDLERTTPALRRPPRSPS